MLDVACVARPIFNDIENQTTLAPGQIFGRSGVFKNLIGCKILWASLPKHSVPVDWTDTQTHFGGLLYTSRPVLAHQMSGDS